MVMSFRSYMLFIQDDISECGGISLQAPNQSDLNWEVAGLAELISCTLLIWKEHGTVHGNIY